VLQARRLGLRIMNPNHEFRVPSENLDFQKMKMKIFNFFLLF
jgi:hypothetical protein